jgi:hypothetical protein
VVHRRSARKAKEGEDTANITLLEPCHVPPVYVLGTHSAVRFPSVIVHEMTGQHFIPRSSNKCTPLRAVSIARHREPEIDLHLCKVPAGRVTFQLH